MDEIMSSTASPRSAGTLAIGALAVVTALLFVVLTAAIVARGGAPLAIDVALHRSAVERRSGWLTTTALAVTSTGSGLPAYAIAAAAGYAAAGDAAAARRHWRSAAGYVLALLSGQGIRLILLVTIGRARPPVRDWAGPASGAAFPSGHATTSALVAALVCWVAARRLEGLPRVAIVTLALTWAVAVGLTRVNLGVHWPTDVVGGWLLATALSAGAALALLRLSAGNA
jgi:undecaprenyl-diphosphatase